MGGKGIVRAISVAGAQRWRSLAKGASTMTEITRWSARKGKPGSTSTTLLETVTT
jgi:hypothetical protein